MEEVLVDTSAWIRSFSKLGYNNVKLFLTDLILAEAALTTGMVRLELLQGAKTEEHAGEIADRLTILRAIEANEFIWDEVARLYRTLRGKGFSIAVPDLWIATVAMQARVILLHCDSDFEHIAKYSSLKTLPID